MTLAARAPLLLAFLVCCGGAADAEGPVRVRADAALLPCVRSALDALGLDVRYDSAAWDAPGDADVLVASSAEVTRALESGRADPASDRDVVQVQWLLQARADGAGFAPRTLDEAAHASDGIWLPAGALSYDARRALEPRFPGRLRQARDLAELGDAPVAVVPATLPAPGQRRAVLDLPPLLVRAAASNGSAARGEVRRVLDFLGSETGRSAFGACSAP